jgi:hypothetical protein
MQLIVVVVLVFSIMLIGSLNSTHGTAVGGIIFILYSAAVVSCLHVLLLRPYIELLKACVVLPTKRMNRIKCIEAKSKFDAVKRAVSRFDPAPSRSSESTLEELVYDSASEFMRQLKSAEKEFGADDKRRRLSADQKKALIQERNEVFTEAFDIDGLRAEMTKIRERERIVKMIESVITAIEIFRSRVEKRVWVSGGKS